MTSRPGGAYSAIDNFGLGSVAGQYVCTDCGHFGIPIEIESAKAYKKFVEMLKKRKASVKKKIESKRDSEVQNTVKLLHFVKCDLQKASNS